MLGSDAYGRMDLLTVVEHELGHLLGFAHDSTDVMDDTLVAGMRVTPLAVGSTPASIGLAGIVPASEIVLGSVASPQAASNTSRDSSIGGSFVNIGLSGSGAASVAIPEDASPAGSHGRLPNAAAGTAPIIDWGTDRAGAWKGLASGSDQSQDWLDDFLNHLGRSEVQRNPNAGIRVRPSIANAAR
jgi:hypothetical protein